jgi:hypothetical protein
MEIKRMRECGEEEVISEMMVFGNSSEWTETDPKVGNQDWDLRENTEKEKLFTGNDTNG